MRAANLLPSDLRTTRRRVPVPALAMAGAGVLVGSVLAVAFVTVSGTVDSKRAQLAQLEAELGTLNRPVETGPTLVDRTAEEGERMKVLGDTLSTRVPWDRVLSRLALVLPDDIWLQSLSATSPTAVEGAESGAPTSQGLLLTGRTYSQESVARLLTRVALIPEVQDVTLQKSEKAEVSNQSVYDFAIQATVKAPGGTS